MANQQGLLATYLPSSRHTWFQLGVCTYKQLAMAAYWSGSAMLTASQDRHKLLMNDIHSYSRDMTTQFRSEVFRGQRRSDSELFRSCEYRAVKQKSHSDEWQREREKVKYEAWIKKLQSGSLHCVISNDSGVKVKPLRHEVDSGFQRAIPLLSCQFWNKNTNWTQIDYLPNWLVKPTDFPATTNILHHLTGGSC